jgi:hypothetical protein
MKTAAGKRNCHELFNAKWHQHFIYTYNNLMKTSQKKYGHNQIQGS